MRNWQLVASSASPGHQSLSARCEVCLGRILAALLTTPFRMMLGVAYLSKAYLILNLLFERGAPVLPTFVIGLREGLEAALIVGIIAAFLGQQGRKDALRQVWIGTATAVAICIGVAIALQVISSDLPQRQQEGLETVVGALAIGMVTYMIVFMRKHARSMKKDLQGAAASALAQGSSRALVMMAFLAVLREGFETAVFLLATFHASGDASTSWLGAVLGIVRAAGIAYGIYKGVVKLNLARFFRVTGLVLVVVAAGLVMTALHTAYEAGWLLAGPAQAFDPSSLVPPGTPGASCVV